MSAAFQEAVTIPAGGEGGGDRRQRRGAGSVCVQLGMCDRGSDEGVHPRHDAWGVFLLHSVNVKWSPASACLLVFHLPVRQASLVTPHCLSVCLPSACQTGIPGDSHS